jgi:hypothetical protein
MKNERSQTASDPLGNSADRLTHRPAKVKRGPDGVGAISPAREKTSKAKLLNSHLLSGSLRGFLLGLLLLFLLDAQLRRIPFRLALVLIFVRHGTPPRYEDNFRGNKKSQ